MVAQWWWRKGACARRLDQRWLCALLGLRVVAWQQRWSGRWRVTMMWCWWWEGVTINMVWENSRAEEDWIICQHWHSPRPRSQGPCHLLLGQTRQQHHYFDIGCHRLWWRRLLVVFASVSIDWKESLGLNRTRDWIERGLGFNTCQCPIG